MISLGPSPSWLRTLYLPPSHRILHFDGPHQIQTNFCFVFSHCIFVPQFVSTGVIIPYSSLTFWIHFTWFFQAPRWGEEAEFILLDSGLVLIVCMYHILVSHSSLIGHTVCFQVLANTVCVVMDIHTFFWMNVSWGHSLRSGISGSYDRFILRLLRVFQTAVHRG